MATKSKTNKPRQIQPITASRKIAGLIYGDTGSGKTRLIGTKGKGMLILRPPTDHTDSIRTPGVEEWVVRDWSEMIEVLEWARHDAGKEFTDVALDTISLWQDTGLDDIWETVIMEKPHRARYGLDKQEYGINMHRLSQWVRHMVGCQNFNFWITAHPAELPPSMDPDADEKLMPYVQGKNMASKVCATMNVVAYLDVKYNKKKKKDERILRFNGTEKYYAKDQFDAFPKGRLVEPTMPQIMKCIESARKGNAMPKTNQKRK